MAFVVDEDVDMRGALGEFLENEGFEPILFAEPKEALAAFTRGAPVLVITDSWTRSVWSAQFDGLLSEANRSGCPVIIFTGWKTTLLSGRSAVPIVSKPDIRTLQRFIRSHAAGPARRGADVARRCPVDIAA
jgi:DNA-binding NtrC family response regulator